MLHRIFSKKVMIIAGCVLAAVAAAVLAVVLILHGAKTAVQTDLPLSSSFERESSDISLPEEFEAEPVDNGIRLVLTSPASLSMSTTEPSVILAGTSDPAEPLTMNGADVTRDASGSFSMDVQLNVGKNTFTFLHKGETTVCTVNYRYVVINAYSPDKAQIYASGSTVVAAVNARAGSTVTATFNGTTVPMTHQVTAGEEAGQVDSAVFVDFYAPLTMPSGNATDLQLGKIKFTATYNGITESFYSGEITCERSNLITDSDPTVTPTGGEYIDVGSGYVAEIVAYSAETFNGRTTDDMSRPTNNYLPQGTVDYSSTGLVYDAGSGNSYAVLRCGRRVYIDKKDAPGGRVPVTSQYIGTLPDHNELNVASVTQSTRFTTITFDTLWKAPFLLDLLPQQYTNPATQDYTISAATYRYVDITFCYATVLTGEITFPEDHPVFSRAEIIQNQYDYTLRLHLKKTGAFYGWDASYNAAGQLVFTFLHPARISTASNAYGVDLTGVKILIDAGHGGIDPGAPGLNSAAHPESERNLNLALKIKAQLESIGATVVMDRYDNSTVTADERCRILKREQPDFCIAVHHDSSTSTTPNGFGAFHSNVFSSEAARAIYRQVVNTGIYSAPGESRTRFQWHYYYVARMTACPVVLTENGFISSSRDFPGIVDETTNVRKAEAITRGIVEYFKSIQ